MILTLSRNPSLQEIGLPQPHTHVLGHSDIQSPASAQVKSVSDPLRPCTQAGASTAKQRMRKGVTREEFGKRTVGPNINVYNLASLRPKGVP